MWPSSPTSTTARPRWSIRCCASPACSAKSSSSAAAQLHPRLQRPGARARHHHPGQEHRPRRRRHQDQHHRHARPRRLRRRGRARAQDGRRLSCCSSTPPRGRCRRRASCCARRSSAGCEPIVVINKIDRPDARPTEVLNAVFDLFVELGRRRRARSTSRPSTPPAAQGIATTDLAIPAEGPQAAVRRDPRSTSRRRRSTSTRRCRCWCVTLDYSDYVGRIAIGRVFAGKIKKGQRVALLKHDGKRDRRHGRAALHDFDRLGRIETDEVAAGDICAVVGLDDVDIGDTIADFDNPVALPPITIDEPTLDMVFRINDSPFAGQDGTHVTSRQLRDRLMKELESNVALRVAPERGRARRVHRLRPRPAAPVDPAGEHAPRGLRAVGRQAAGHHQGDRRRDDGADRVPGRSRCRPTRSAPVMELVLAIAGPSASRWKSRGELTHIGVHDPGPRPDRPAHAAAERHQRPGDHAPQLLRLPADAQAASRPRLNGVMVSTETGTATGSRAREPAGARHPVRRRRWSRSTRARSSASTAATTICR